MDVNLRPSLSTINLPEKFTRRGFLRRLGGMMLGAAVMGVGGLTYMNRIEPGGLEVVHRELTLPRLHPAFAGFRLVQISDIHWGEMVNQDEVSEACTLALQAKPDLIALTGDYVESVKGLARSAADLARTLRPLTSAVPTIAVVGNHDYTRGITVIRQMLQDLGVQELRNAVFTLNRNDAVFHFAGVDDIRRGRPQLRQVLSQLPAEGAAVLLAHEPDYADISARSGRFDLQISGHSHGGQVVLPIIGPPVLPTWGQKYPSGLYQVGSMMQYTNRGLGMTSPYLRLNCRPEMTIFTFQSRQG